MEVKVKVKHWIPPPTPPTPNNHYLSDCVMGCVILLEGLIDISIVSG
jgi:hypothetical protein